MALDPLQSFIAEACALLGVGILFIGLRLYVRWSTNGFSNSKPDDWIMIFAGILYALETTAACLVGAKFHGLANNGMTEVERRTLSPDSPEYHLRVGGSKLQLIGWSLYTGLLWTLKLCVIIFYTRLTENLTTQKNRIRFGFVLLAATYVATILSILWGCGTFHKNWQIYPDPGNHCQPAISKIDCYVTVVLNVATDLYLMSIPLPLLWKAQLQRKQKWLLLGMFSGALFVMMAGILRCALIIADPVHGAQKAGAWACRETFVAVVIGNLPMIYPLVRRGANATMAAVSTRKSSIFGGTAGTGESNGGSFWRKGSAVSSSNKNPMSMPTATESEERIYHTRTRSDNIPFCDGGIKSEKTFEVRTEYDTDLELGNMKSGSPVSQTNKTGYSVHIDGPMTKHDS